MLLGTVMQIGTWVVVIALLVADRGYGYPCEAELQRPHLQQQEAWVYAAIASCVVGRVTLESNGASNCARVVEICYRSSVTDSLNSSRQGAQSFREPLAH